MSTTIYPAANICADFISRALSTPRSNSQPLFVGFQGPQGCGKTTLTSQIKAALQALPTPINAVVFSIDDLYLPYSGLTQLAQTHPDNALLNGRGQPGTHDPVLGSTILEQLAHINENEGEVNLPVFDKSAYGGYGDRSDEVVVVRPPVDVVILEGWCFGFQPLEDEELKKRYDSPDDGCSREGEDAREAPSLYLHKFFRSHSLGALADINSSLKGYAELWYKYFTHFIQIVPEDLHYVFEWRLQQEHAMKLKNGGRGMTDEQVHNFVARYMPGYELFQDTIEAPSNPWHGRGIRIELDRQRAVIRTEQF
ncbi:hypothetical protein FRC08_010405 [Ceratobasidium sp. 394]|nr:hypothetical protein FRC08_010405 [Ceratobasidium sp. 394]KAG9095140.1 hypothetical protein FS749_011006 [Ceratobasidium sp. UAMH 11750]